MMILAYQLQANSGNSVSGLNFVLTSARSSGRPSIATMSLGGGASTSLDNAVASVRLLFESDIASGH